MYQVWCVIIFDFFFFFNLMIYIWRMDEADSFQ